MQNYDSSSNTSEKKDILFSQGPLMETQGNHAEHCRNKITGILQEWREHLQPPFWMLQMLWRILTALARRSKSNTMDLKGHERDIGEKKIYPGRWWQ